MPQSDLVQDISLETIRERLDSIKKRMEDTNKGLRLTNIQKESIGISFDVFVQNLQRIEQGSFEKHDSLYVFSDEYQLTALVKDFLYKKPFSVFACFKCRILDKMQSKSEVLLKQSGKVFHKCDDLMVGEGIQTNWKSLYYLFYEDYTIRKYIIGYFKNNSKEITS